MASMSLENLQKLIYSTGEFANGKIYNKAGARSFVIKNRTGDREGLQMFVYRYKRQINWNFL